MSNYTLTFYVNREEGCVSCHPDEKPLCENWIVSSKERFTLREIEKASAGIDSVYFKVTPEVYDAVLESHNIN